MSLTLSFGARPLPGGGTRFRLWAPGQARIALLVQGEEPRPMQRDAEGWWELDTELAPGTRYRYRLSDGMEVPDPASHAQEGDPQGWSLVVDHAAFAWQHADFRPRPWPQQVVYELHLGAAGGIDAVIADLPRLRALGITTLELMPVNDFAGLRNWGYDGVLPYAPDEAYGTPQDLKRLVDAAHGQGLAVMLDVVYNHFGPSGNYWHAITPAFFHKDQKNPWGEAIDFTREPVRRFFIENALLWLDTYRFDGLRLDAVHAIGEPSFLPELSARIRGATEGREIALVLENERNDAALLERDFDGQWNDDIHHCLHVLLTGESVAYYGDYADDPAGRLARGLAEGFVYQGETSKNLGHARGTPSAHLPPSRFVNSLQTHDQVGNRAMGDRIAALAEPEALRAAWLLLLLSPQVPMLFMGEEWASVRPFQFFVGFEDPELQEAVREGRRREFARFPAFADPEQRARIPDPNAEATFRNSCVDPAERQQPRHAEFEALTAKLLALRHAQLAPHLERAVSMGATPLGQKGVRAQWKLGNGAVLTIAAQLGDSAIPCEAGPGEVLAQTGAGHDGKALAARSAIAWLAGL